MTTATLTRPARGPALPQPGTWTIDPDRAVVAFSGKASFLTPTIKARFLHVNGSIEVADGRSGPESAIAVSVDVTTVTTGNPVWDEVIHSFDPFQANRYPVAVYRSTSVRWSAGQAVIDGALTLRGVTRSVALTASYDVSSGRSRMLVRAAGSIDRSGFGVSFDVPGCGKLVPRVMRLEIDADVVHTG